MAEGTTIYKKGALVLVRYEWLPPLQWPLGRIVDVHPVPDGLTIAW